MKAVALLESVKPVYMLNALACLILLAGCSKKGEALNSVRPEGFPEALVVPESAYSINYSTPATGRAPHTYGIMFTVDESFPGENVRGFLEEALKAKGWRSLQCGITAPGQPARWWRINIAAHPEHEGKSWLLWDEHWINRQEDVITIILEYPVSPKKDLSKVYVDVGLSEKESIRGPVQGYKERHPEEFVEGVSSSGRLVRPDGFPEALVVPEHAYSTMYVSPSRMFPAGTYLLQFLVDDPFPAENMRSFIEETLKAKGWRKLQYNVWAPEERGGRWTTAERGLDKGTRHWTQDWVNEHDDVIKVSFQYALPEEYDNLTSTLFVVQFLFEKGSRYDESLEECKQRHPEEFPVSAPERGK